MALAMPLFSCRRRSRRHGIENLLASVYNNCIMYAEGKALGPAEDSSDRRWS